MTEWTLTTTRPRDFARLADWFGVWSIEEQAGRALSERLQSLDLRIHVDGVLAAAPLHTVTGTPLYTIQDGVAVLLLQGTLLKYASSLGGTSTVELRRGLRAALRDPLVQGLLLHIDSPGGTVAGVGDLADEVFRARQQKPVIAYIEDLGASAAYQIASQADEVLVNPTGAVGSLGVYSVVEDTSERSAAMKVKVHVIRAGAYKGAGTPGTPVTEEQLQEWQRLVDAYASALIEAVARGRGRPKAEIATWADGRVHVGPAAVALGLADRVGTWDEALHAVRQRAQRRAHEKGLKMSEPTPTTFEMAAAAPLPASLAELKAACPGASSDFLLAQLEAQATVQQALQAWNAHLLQELQQARHAAPAQTGVTPLTGSPLVQVEASSASERFDMLVRERLVRLGDRWAAIRAVAREHPELYQQFLLETNPTRKAQRLIHEKLN